ncbi:MAG: Unknown protein [uncultured Thiotrichaceae bacterium]|uniref:F5/8 type C domain-containing protein n=1 Tax=uncultured Thiotrichaceae bacterium TaxID=298394 RepID=A0A6S6SSX1_9GAMM|nr:MAG: Unknown protein [uncultured Thiotrichaceae bacterium]
MNKKSVLKQIIGVIAGSLLSVSVQAKDTDIYFPDVANATGHNVMFIMDVSGSMRTQVPNTTQNRYEAMKGAFNDVLSSMPASVNVGLMNFGSIGNDRHDFAQGVKFPVSPLNANAKDTIRDGLPLKNGSPNWDANNIPTPADADTVLDYLPNVLESWSPRGYTPLVDALYEASLYYRGEKVTWGLGPLEEEGNEWVANPSTYTGEPSGWNGDGCETVFTERLISNAIPTSYSCPQDVSNLGADGDHSYCLATATECIPYEGGGGTVDTIEMGNVSSDDSKDDYETFTHTLEAGSNRMVIVGVQIEDNSSSIGVESITYGGIDMNPIAGTSKTQSNGSWRNKTQMFYLKESELPSDGQHTVIIEVNGNEFVAGAVTVKNVAQDGPEAVATNSDTSDDSFTTSITSLSDNVLLLDIAGAGRDFDDGALEAYSGQTELWSEDADDSDSQASMSYREVASAGSYNMRWDWDDDDEDDYNRAVHSVIALAPSTSAPSNTNFQMGNVATMGGGNDAQSVSHVLEAGTNRVVLAAVAIERNGTPSITSITYGGVAMNSVAGSADIVGSSTKMRTELFYLLDADLPSDGNNTFSVTINGGEMSAGVVTLSGLKQQAAESVETEASSNYTSSNSLSITTTSSNVVLVDLLGAGASNGSFDVNSSQTEIWSESANSSRGTMSAKVVNSAGSHAMSWEWDSNSHLNRYSHSLAAFELAENLVYPEARYVKLVAKSSTNDGPYTSLAELDLYDEDGNQINNSGWSATVDSFEPTGEGAKGGHASHAIDGNDNTFWHTEWLASNPDPAHDHSIIVDLGQAYHLKELHHLPRQDGGENGRIDDYEIYVSMDGSTWGSAVATGNFINNSSEQVVEFDKVAAGISGSGSGTGAGGGTGVPGALADTDEALTAGSCVFTMCAGKTSPLPTYASPVVSECQSNSIILLSDGSPQASKSVQVNATYDKIKTEQAWSGGLADIFDGLSCASNPQGYPRGTCGPELTDYISKHDNLPSVDGDQYIDTYTIGLGLGQSSNAEKYLESLSSVDDPNTQDIEGYYSADDKQELLTAFSTILQDIVTGEASTSFSNPGYSIVARTGLNHEDSVFIPTFKVSNDVVWEGNLKKFKIVNVNGKRKIRGKNNLDAVSELGIFTNNAHDYWSQSTQADGEAVENGGVASLLKAPANREVYVDLETCSGECNLDLSSSTNALNISNASTMTNTDLGLVSDASADDRKALICFARGAEGYDTTNDECMGGARKHMGDMLHFEPIVVTYDDDHDDENDATHKQVIFAGTNEGYLHAFDTHSGEELWAFMPRSLLKNIKPQYDNNEYRGHRYGVDGYAKVWKKSATETYFYYGLRRGGNEYYAFDISDPSVPKLMWKIVGETTGFEHLGQTWSQPYISKMRDGTSDDLIPVVVFTGGYDTNQDKALTGSDARAIADTVGNDVFIVNAETGSLIFSAQADITAATLPGVDGDQLTHSIPGGARLLDMDRDGGIDRMYFGDVAGQLWRLDLNVGDLDASVLVKLASLGGGDIDTEPRKFFNEPDASITRVSGETKLLLSLGSGDRSDPLEETVINRFYVIKDDYILSDIPSDYETIDDTDTNFERVIMSGTEGGISVTSSFENDENLVQTDKKGWSVQFSAVGEKVLGGSLTSHGKVVFTTLVPDVYANSSTTVCGIPATQGRFYALDILSGEAAVDLDDDGGDPDANDMFTVVSANEIPGDVQVIFNAPSDDTGGDCSEGNCVQNVDFRVGKKLSQIFSFNAGVLESISWGRPQK